VQPLIDKQANRFELRLEESLGTMTSDGTRVRQILLNLLSNAAKFTEQGLVTLSVKRSTRGPDGWILFEVADSGIGMSTSQLMKLFQPFVQADVDTTRKYGGTGLGLVISRRLCRMLGGDVSVDSVAGGGSRFTVRLPSRIPEGIEPPGSPATPRTAVRLPAPQLLGGSIAGVGDASHDGRDRRGDPVGGSTPAPVEGVSMDGIGAPALFRISQDGAPLSLNLPAARMFGYGTPTHMMESVTDVGAQVFASPGVWAGYRRRLLDEGFITNFEFQARRADGSLLWVSQDACVVRGDAGEVSHFEGFSRDITELKRSQDALRLAHDAAQAGEARVRAIVHAAPVFLLLLRDSDGVILQCNPRSKPLFGYAPAELVGRSVHVLFHAHTVGGGRVIEALERDGRASDMEIEFLRANGSRFWGSLSAEYLSYGGTSALVAGIHDITELRTARLRAEDASRAKSLFLANMSSELLTPLNAIISCSQRLENQDATDGPRQDDLRTIAAAGGRLQAMIERMLELARLEAGQLVLAPEQLDVASVLEEVASHMRAIVERQGNRFSVTLAPDLGSAHADPGRLRQVLKQLLTNAAKMTRNGAVRLEGTRAPDAIEITVTDQGPTMTPEQRLALFEPFADDGLPQVDGGLSLGLALSRRMCEAMGARLWVADRGMGGASFTVALPLQAAPGERAPGDTPTAAAA
jgi:PAS domain S-box-containing protein